MARRFVEESTLPFTFDEDLSIRTLSNSLDSDRNIILVGEDEGILTGAILGTVEQDFCHEKCAYVVKMYVDKEFRGLGTARALVEAFQYEAIQKGAVIIFAAATAGMGDRVERLFVRLFERYGYQVLGRVLVKEVSRG